MEKNVMLDFITKAKANVKTLTNATIVSMNVVLANVVAGLVTLLLHAKALPKG